MRKLLLILLTVGIFFNTFQLTIKILQHSQQESGFLGNQFLELLPLFNQVRKAGYYTDKDLKDTKAIAQFEQAQYVLAPTVLDLNNTNHQLIILDCTSPEIAVKKMNELGLRPLRASHLGLVLAVNPNAGDIKP